ncbi:uncharacterized protein C8Q71DRAFT_852145 [Rhodofomes roseus]|uniref:C2H2-type domain-containing protein n=1 Tax=Rhodofomes roseus TaxID=34475 RepID=A0ABQ8KYE6_9APHY|nr:uncharacterized protein C8Q71DRAFT_852145 [Rhodofomes roseus]KAH9843620.1 hypothetical protein C8Q71DRAFT_852145 [Rhodofomes roseus]
MSPPHSPKNISLPSINELFPEHLMAKPPSPIQRYPSSSCRTSPTSHYAPEPNFNYPDVVASSSNVPDSYRNTVPGAFGYAGCGPDQSMSLVTKAKPTFRVELRVSEHGLSVPPYERFPRPDEHKTPAPYPPSFSANPYLSGGAVSAGSSQGLRGPQSPQDGPPGSEEKRHCCPHCNKRFNRPSSLNIHVNTHTGAKPFVCSYPGCNRRFNVNSNMRRHYRNHLTSRRRDAVARLIQHPSGSAHSPPLSASPSRSPEPVYSPGSSYRYSLAPYPLEHSASYSDPEEYDTGRSPPPNSTRHHPYARPPSPPSPRYAANVKRETPEPALPVGVPESNLREDRDRVQCRLRSNSSPMPRYREDRTLRHAEPVCDRPGCSCNARPVSTALRPAFPEYLPPSQAGGERSRPYGP